jgi:hypothetical protein
MTMEVEVRDLVWIGERFGLSLAMLPFSAPIPVPSPSTRIYVRLFDNGERIGRRRSLPTALNDGR